MSKKGTTFYSSGRPGGGVDEFFLERHKAGQFDGIGILFSFFTLQEDTTERRRFRTYYNAGNKGKARRNANQTKGTT